MQCYLDANKQEKTAYGYYIHWRFARVFPAPVIILLYFHLPEDFTLWIIIYCCGKIHRVFFLNKSSASGHILTL